jgi:Tfp pilus assembly protein PilN
MPVARLLTHMAEVQQALAKELNAIEIGCDDDALAGQASGLIANLQSLDSIRQQIENMSRLLELLAARVPADDAVRIAELRAVLNLHGLAHRLITGTNEEKSERFPDSALHLF